VIPIHFNVNWEPDGYGKKHFLLIHILHGLLFYIFIHFIKSRLFSPKFYKKSKKLVSFIIVVYLLRIFFDLKKQVKSINLEELYFRELVFYEIIVVSLIFLLLVLSFIFSNLINNNEG